MNVHIIRAEMFHRDMRAIQQAATRVTYETVAGSAGVFTTKN
jgi:hypothetical protein